MTGDEIIQLYRRGIKIFREESVDGKVAAEPVRALGDPPVRILAS